MMVANSRFANHLNWAYVIPTNLIIGTLSFKQTKRIAKSESNLEWFCFVLGGLVGCLGAMYASFLLTGN
jgi:hypothetical protein